MVLAGAHSDRRGERRWHVALPAMLGGTALALGAHSTSIAIVIVAISLAVMGLNAMLGPFWAMPTAFLSGTAAAAGIALINSVGNIGGFFGPYIIGLVRTCTGTFRGGLLFSGVCFGDERMYRFACPSARIRIAVGIGLFVSGIFERFQLRGGSGPSLRLAVHCAGPRGALEGCNRLPLCRRD